MGNRAEGEQATQAIRRYEQKNYKDDISEREGGNLITKERISIFGCVCVIVLWKRWGNVEIGHDVTAG